MRQASERESGEGLVSIGEWDPLLSVAKVMSVGGRRDPITLFFSYLLVTTICYLE